MRKRSQLGASFMVSMCAVFLTLALAFRSSADEPQEKTTGPRNVAILIFDGVEVLDFAGPTDVFTHARDPKGRPAFKLYAVAKSMKPITSQGFVTITPNFTFADCPAPDILVIPGGGTGGVVKDEATMKWIKDTGPKSERVVSVCTGAFILQTAGFLDGLKATTHWSAIELLRKQAPNTTVLENVRYVDSGHVVTSAGVSAGIDMTLHVVAKLLGFDAAEKAALNMEYEWKPREEYPKG
jgi:transcriptional regulator GlxA family with amidase domain